MSYSTTTDIEPFSEENRRRGVRVEIRLTPEEQRIIKECSREGIIKRGIPMGVLFGISGLLAAKAGPLMHKRFGVKPAVIGFGVLGYFVGRFSYASICMQRAVDQVPDGTLSFLLKKNKDYGDEAQTYVAIDAPRSDERASAPQNSDIDIPSTSSFDTVPSDYYQEITEDTLKQEAAKNYTSYDDLRKQNRQEYKKKFFSDIPSDNQNRPIGQTDAPRIVRKPIIQQEPSGQRTKYGDVWDA